MTVEQQGDRCRISTRMAILSIWLPVGLYVATRRRGWRSRNPEADDLAAFESERSWWATVDQIRKMDYNLTVGRYCPHQACAIEHEKPEVLINRLLELEEDIKTDLEDLLTLVTVPTSVDGLRGSVRFETSTEE